MKNFDSRAYSINDFLEWEKNKQLELSPRFQRGSVWSDNARSYLMDTIVCGKPIPKIFIRQKINPSTKNSIREVVDGQQRLRTILSYLHDGFQISKKHNAEYGGRYYSQLDTEAQTNILNYEISVDLLVNMPDAEVLDVFGRLNSYAVTLNEQEKIHANHFGPFKNLADKVGHKYVDFWIDNKIVTDQQVIRMGDVTLSADLLIAMIEGIRSKKQIRAFYAQYEQKFEADPKVLESCFDKTIQDISLAFEGGLKKSEFHRIHIFYSLFTAMYHLRWGLKDLNLAKLNEGQWNYSRIRGSLSEIDEIFNTEDRRNLTAKQNQFLDDSRRATTDAKIRVRRARYLIEIVLDSI